MRKKLPKQILADMYAIRKKGLTYYQENYFWPVPEKEHRNFVQLMHDTYISLISNMDDKDAFNISLVDYKFIIEPLEGIFHYNYIKEFSKKYDIDILSGNESKRYMDPDWHNISLFYTKLSFPFGKVQRVIRRLVKNIIFNRHLSVWKQIKGFFLKKETIGIGSYDRLKREFIEKQSYYCDHREWIDMIPTKELSDSDKVSKLVQHITKNVINPFISKLQNENNLFVKNMDFSQLKKSWICRLNDATFIYLALKQQSKPKRLLVTEMAKPHSRLFTMAFQEECDVYGFHHGNDSGLTVYKVGHQSERAHCKKLVVPTDGIAREFSKIYSNDPIGRVMKTEFISADSLFYQGLLSSLDQSIPNVKTKKIMIIGAPANPNRYIHEQGQFFYVKIDLELRLIKALKKHNYNVIYKVHPDRAVEIRGLFEDYVDEYNVEPFEEVWTCADTFIFTDTASTTFGFSLATKKNIVLLNNKFDERNQFAQNLLKKRVRLVDMFMDDDLHLQFDSNSLIYALENPHSTIDYSFVHEILS